jgi:RNA polymerase sigma-70 factor (ECF subfamily)
MGKIDYSAKSNQRLVQECLAEQTLEAWQEFVRRFQPLISGIVAQVARHFDEYSPEVITDLTQEVYLRLCSNGYKLLKEHRGAHDNSLFGYLKVISASVAHDHFKAKLRVKRGSGIPMSNMEEALGAAVARPLDIDNKLLMAEIKEALSRIVSGKTAERDQLIFWLHYRQGFTSAEIAAIPNLGLSEKGISSLLQRLTSSLRNALAVESAKGQSVNRSHGLTAFSGE